MNQSAETYSIDANIIVRYVIADNVELFAKAVTILRGVESGQTSVICDPVNLAEVVWVLSSIYNLTNKQIYDGLLPILNPQGFQIDNKERYLLALKLLAEGMKSFGDACACAAAIENCDGRLYSFDRRLSKAPGVHRTERLGDANAG